MGSFLLLLQNVVCLTFLSASFPSPPTVPCGTGHGTGAGVPLPQLSSLWRWPALLEAGGWAEGVDVPLSQTCAVVQV